MTTKNLPGPDGPDLVAPDWAGADACTLPTAERPVRLAEFDQLFATSLRSVDRLTETHARLLLRTEPGVDGAPDTGLAARVQTLADAESACCSFFTFTVTPLQGATEPPGDVHLDIQVPGAYTGVLDGFVDLARTSADLDAGAES